jgi:thiol reductant ABC exporter CydD subunit
VRGLDPRLIGRSRAAQRYVMLSVALGAAGAFLVVTQAWFLAVTVSGAFSDHERLGRLLGPLLALLGVVAVRAALPWASETAAVRTSAAVKSQLRLALARRIPVLDLGAGSSSTGDLATLATRGIDALDGYFARYLPQVVLAALVPTTVLAVVLDQDWSSALIIAVTLPLVPLFMALIGASTRERSSRQLRTLQRLSGHFLDVVAGLPTLKVFGRAKAQALAIREVTEINRRATMSTLRVTFLSSLALELVSTLSVALVAVAVGLRLLGGHLDLRTALFVLVLAPEAYLPLRALGANFHASAEGISAAEQVFEVLERPGPPGGVRRDVPDPAAVPVELKEVVVRYPSRSWPVLDRLSLKVEPGETLALTGPSGCGKSTCLKLVLGFLEPDGGSVLAGGTELACFDADDWRSRIAWVPQRPHLLAGTIEDNIRLGRPGATARELEEAVAAAGLAGTVSALPRGIGTLLGDRGSGVSAGERQRIALARAFLRDAPLLLLDEPTANLDGRTEDEVIEGIGRLSAGRTVLLVAHRPALLSIADRVESIDAVEARR